MQPDPSGLDLECLAWHEAALHLPLEGFQSWALTYLKPLLPFQRALWGMGVAQPDGPTNLARLQAYPLADRGRGDLEPSIALEPLLQATTRAPGVPVHGCLNDARWQDSRYAALREYASRHGWINVLSLSRFEPHAQSFQFILLARDDSRRFSDQEARQLERLAAHMMLSFATLRALSVARGNKDYPKTPVTGTALVDSKGLIHEADQRFRDYLSVEWPDWLKNGDLPTALGEFVRTVVPSKTRLQGSTAKYAGRTLSASFTSVHDFYFVQIRARQLAEELTEREHAIAAHYATGASHKEIAQTLGIAPTTVRAHLRKIFAKLNIDSKAQLGSKLRQ